MRFSNIQRRFFNQAGILDIENLKNIDSREEQELLDTDILIIGKTFSIFIP